MLDTIVLQYRFVFEFIDNNWNMLKTLQNKMKAGKMKRKGESRELKN